MNAMVGFKFFLFRHQWWILVASTAIAVVALVMTSQPLGIVLSVLGTIGSMFYFLQKQNLEELTLFRQLFREFNCRYDRMNEKLADIADSSDMALTPEDRHALIDYFNLCGEEHFYYSRGFVDPRVWKAWRNGMLQYLRHGRIRALWDEEVKSDSYYGLRL